MLSNCKLRGKKASSQLAAALALTYCPLVMAQAELTSATQRLDPMSAEYAVKTILGMIFVIGIIVALAWLVRRMGKMSGMLSGQIKIISSLSVGTREKILLIQVGDEQFLLGATQNNINRLARIRHTIEAVTPPGAHNERATFQSLLAKLKNGAQS